MANKRIKDLTDTITAFRTGDVIPVDGPSGTAKMSKDDLLKETAQNALGSIHSLSDTATEADLVADNYLALGGSAGPKKLPGNCVALGSTVINRTILDNGFNLSESKSYQNLQRVWALNETFNGTISKINVYVKAGCTINLMKCNGTTNTLIQTVTNSGSLDAWIEVSLSLNLSVGEYIGESNENNGTDFITVIGGAGYGKGNTRVFLENGTFNGITYNWSVGIVLTADVSENTNNAVAETAEKLDLLEKDVENLEVSIDKSLLADSGFIIGRDFLKTNSTTPWCINKTFDGIAKKIRVYVCENTTIDIVACDGRTVVKIDEITNTKSVPSWIEKTIDLPIKSGTYIGYRNQNYTDKLYLVGSASYTEGDARTYKGNGQFNTITNKWSVGIIIEAEVNVSTESSITELLGLDSRMLRSSYFLEKLTDYVLIPIYGQSLSIGWESTPALTTRNKYGVGLMLGEQVWQKGLTEVEADALDLNTLVESSRETCASATIEKMVELFQEKFGILPSSKFYEKHKFVFVSCGDGSKSIEKLMESGQTPPSLYDGLVNVINSICNRITAVGKSVSVPLFVWVQGETDQGTNYISTYANYKTALATLQANIDAVAKNATGQTSDVVCITAQCGAQGYLHLVNPTYSTALRLMGAPMAQMELARDNSNFGTIAPTYCLEHHQDDSIGANIHLTNVGERQLGGYVGEAIASILGDGIILKGLLPATYSVAGNDIVIKYATNSLPLFADKNYVKDDGHLGFKVIKSDDSNILSDVCVFNGEVTLHCTESPVGCMMAYGLNAEDGYDGRVSGSRGNIRDNYGSDSTITGAALKYRLDNWSYCFSCQVVAGSDNLITQE